MSRYESTKLRNLGPVDGFLIHTPDDRKLKDTHPQTIVRELNRLNVEIEEKRKDVVWLATEKAKLEERIKRLEELGKELRECANLIGNYKSNEMETIEQAEAAVEAWDKEAKL